VVLYTVVGGGHQIPGASAGSSWLLGRSVPEMASVEVLEEFFGLPRPDRSR
jgi:hypothetical protein